MSYLSALRTGLVLLAFVFLSGCPAALLVPAAGLANLAHKSGTMTVRLEGANAISAFRQAAIAEGGTVPIQQRDYARAEFSNVDIKIEAQVVGQTVTLRASSLSNVGRTYALEDSITTVTDAVARRMEAQGLRIASSDRKRL